MTDSNLCNNNYSNSVPVLCAEGPPGSDRRAHGPDCSGDGGPGQNGGRGRADGCRGSLGERSALLGQQGEAFLLNSLNVKYLLCNMMCTAITVLPSI